MTWNGSTAMMQFGKYTFAISFVRFPHINGHIFNAASIFS